MISWKRIALPLMASLAVVGCGGGSSSSDDGKDDCTTMCEKLTACAGTLDTSVGVLVDDHDFNSENCVARCKEEMAGCADPHGNAQCVEGVTCSAGSEVPTVADAIQACGANNCQ